MQDPENRSGFSTKALSILEERNRAFRILYDTVLEISLASEGEVSVILCRNLVKLSGAESAALASFNSNENKVTLEAVNLNGQDVVIANKTTKENTAVLTNDVRNIYEHTPIRICLDEELCLPSLLPESILQQIDCHETKQCVSFSCIRQKDLIAIGILQFGKDSNFTQKDMVDTYLSMAGMIIQRTNAIAALQRSHKRFQTLMEATSVGIMVTDEQRTIVDMNQAALDLIGKTKFEVIGQKCSEYMLIDQNTCPHWDRNMPIDKEERQLKTAAGQIIPILLSTTQIELDEKDLLLETFVDITERKNQETEKLQLEKQLYHSQKLESLGTLAAGIAHEINTPIQYIGDNVRFLKENIPLLFDGINEYRKILSEIEEKKKEQHLTTQLEKIDDRLDLEFISEELPLAISQSLEGLNRVAEIVQAMKSFSYLDDTKMVTADINKCVNSAIMVTKNEWKYLVNMEIDLEPKLPTINCYVSDINQMLMNLIINATHAIESYLDKNKDTQQGTIRITTYIEDENSIGIKIKDSGCGIPEEIAHKIFDPFFTTKDVGKGTGQGLSMVYSTVTEKHKGKISFESEQGKGTTFCVILPILPPNAETPPLTPQTPIK